jgi:hypothetical protein
VSVSLQAVTADFSIGNGDPFNVSLGAQSPAPRTSANLSAGGLYGGFRSSLVGLQAMTA